MQAGSLLPRPWWACTLVPVYLMAVYGVLLGLFRLLYSSWIGGLYMSVFTWPIFAVAGVAAAFILLLTRHSPWLRPQLDALLAVALGLPLAAVLLCVVAALL
jgi:hypothetical protein